MTRQIGPPMTLTSAEESSLTSQPQRPTRNKVKPKRFAIEDSIEDEESSSDNEKPRKENKSLNEKPRKGKISHNEKPDFSFTTAAVSKPKRKKIQQQNNLEISRSIVQATFCKEVCSTFSALQHPKCNIQVLSDDLIADFLQEGTKGKEDCLYQLISLLFNAAGTKFALQQDISKELAIPVEIIEYIEEQAILQQQQQQPATGDSFVHAFPWDSKEREMKKFVKAFAEFWSCFIQRGFSSILTHDLMLPVLFDWVCAMTSCKYRHFRFVSTLAVFAIVSGLAKGIRVQQAQLETAQQLKTSSVKKRGRKAALATLDAGTITSSIEFAQIQITALLDAVFVHRIRDIDPKIRKEAINSLSTWICTLPVQFGEQISLLSFSLADERALVREAALEALIEISAVPESHATLREFVLTGNNKTKIIDLCLYDLAERVKVLSLNFVKVVVCDLKMFALEGGEFDTLKMLAFHSNLQVRQAAMPIVRYFIECNWSLSMDGLVKFLQNCDRCNSAEIIFSAFKELLAPQLVIPKLLETAGAGGMQTKLLLEFLAAGLKEDSPANARALSVEAFVQLLHSTKEHSASILNVLLSMDAALWTERLEQLKEQVIPQLLSIITGSAEKSLIKKGIEVLYSLTQNPLLASAIQGQKDEFVGQLVAEFALQCASNQVEDEVSESACWRIECISEWEHIPIDFLFAYLSKLLPLGDLGEATGNREATLISCMKALFKSQLHLNAFKLPDALFDLCFLTFSSTSWPKLQSMLSSMLADHFIFSQSSDSLLIERIRQVVVGQILSNAAAVEETQVTTLIKLAVFQMIPIRGSLNALSFYMSSQQHWTERLEALFECSLKKLLMLSLPVAQEILEELLLGIGKAFPANQSATMKTAMVAVAIAKQNPQLFANEAFFAFVQQTIANKNVVLAMPFIPFLDKDQCTKLLLEAEQLDAVWESKQQQSEWEEFVAKVKVRMTQKSVTGAKRGRKPKAVPAASPAPELEEVAVEQEENPFASSPVLEMKSQ